MTAWYHAPLLRAAQPHVLLAAALLAGCGAGATTDYFPGASSAPRGGAAAPAPRAKSRPAPLWAAFDEVRRWPTVGRKPEAARDHAGGRYVGTVRVSPDARAAYAALTRGSTLPADSVVAMFHEDAQGHGSGPVYVMHKRDAGWRYLVLTPDGHIQAQGVLPLCERCHAEATADHLFGHPSDPGQKQP